MGPHAVVDLVTDITRVAVYESEAKVTRSGTADVAPGEQVLVVRDLPELIRPDSVRAKAWGQGVRLRRGFGA